MEDIVILNVIWFCFLYFFFYIGKFFYHVLYSVNYSKRSRSFERISGKPIILVYGDSLAFGTGASSPEKSFIGLLGEHLPHASVINHAAIGFSLDQIIRTMRTRSSGDLVLICGGGIDILFLKPLRHIRKDAAKMFAIAAGKGKEVLMITPINLGLSAIFPWFLRGFYARRSKLAGRILREEAAKYPNIKVLDNLLIESAKDMPPIALISAPDKVHPNDAGYLWAFERAKGFLNGL